MSTISITGIGRCYVQLQSQFAVGTQIALHGQDSADYVATYLLAKLATYLLAKL